MKAPHCIFAVLASVGLVSAVQFTEIAACGQQCYNNVKNDFTVYGCASATDMACLCANRNYSNGIKDCANQSCLGADAGSAALIQTYANDECAAFGAGQPQPNPTFTDGAQPASTSVTPEATTPLGVTSSVAPAEQSPASTTNQAAAATTQDINSPPTSTTLVIVTTSNPASAAATSAATSSSSSSSSGSANSSADSGSKSSDAESSSSDTETGSGGHLGNSAKIGIGVGAGAVAVVFAALLFALCRRRRDNKRMMISNKSDLEISLPLPGSGRTYAADDISSPRSVVALIKGAGRSELELNSTRYENMIPRTQPSLTRVR